MYQFEKNGNQYVDINKGTPVQKWVFDLVEDRVNERLVVVSALDWFEARQLIGEETWGYLVEKRQQITAGICFSYMVEQGQVPVKQVRQECSGKHYYKVTN